MGLRHHPDNKVEATSQLVIKKQRVGKFMSLFLPAALLEQQDEFAFLCNHMLTTLLSESQDYFQGPAQWCAATPRPFTPLLYCHNK